MEIAYTIRKQDRLGKLLGRSAVMQQVFDQLKKAAKIDAPILLQGETGTGKDLAAQVIHHMSAHSDGPYIPINLGALPSEMVASELFGHEKGAFTGAIAQRKGKFEQAKHGTVFLDEIESVDDNIQVSLLRLLEDKRFYRLGGKSQCVTNARITVASNADLRELVRQQTFREDLLYRLDLFPIYMPPLREHPEDIPLLIAAFMEHQSRLLNKQITEFSEECFQVLTEYDWPGNVRELKNVLHRASLLCEGHELRLEHLPPRLHTHPSGPSTTAVSFRIGTSLDEMERTMVLQTLNAVGNNRTEAAQLLGISRRALYNRLKKHRIG